MHWYLHLIKKIIVRRHSSLYFTQVPKDEGCSPLNEIALAKLHQKVAKKFVRDNRPRFCGAKMIYSPYRGDSLPQIKKALETMVCKLIIGRHSAHFRIYDSLIFFLTIQLIQPFKYH